MKKLLIILSIFLTGNTLWAQFYEPKKVTDKFYPDPPVEINIPSLQKGKGFTSYNEMMRFLNELAIAHPSVLNMKTVGKTQRGKDIPLIKLSKGNDENKIRVIYIARVHGDEPSGTEGMMYFIQQMAAGNSQIQYLLDKISVYILPMLNVDGAETNTRRTANGIDMNRDQSKLETPEAQILHHVINEIEPHVSVDYHEYQPVRSDFGKLSSDILGTPWDVMFLYSGNPNVPQVIRTAVDSMFLPEAKKTLDKNGLTHHNYYSSTNSYGNIRINVGGASPRSTTNAIALKNTISMLMETRGIQLGNTALKRRTWSVYLLAETFAKTAYENDEEIRQILKAGLEDRSDVVVRFASKKEDNYPLPFLDFVKNELVTLNVDMSYAIYQRPLQTRPLPEAYYILPDQYRAVRVLQNMGVEITMLPVKETVLVEAHTVTSLRESSNDVGGVYPLRARVVTEKKEMELPAGTFRVDSKQKNIRAATVLLEPESSNGFVNYRVIEVEKGKPVPVFRGIKQ